LTFLISRLRFRIAELLLACKEKWNRDLKDVVRIIDSDASGLATAWVAYRETAKRDMGAVGKKKPQNAEQFLDSLYYRAWYLRQAVGICGGKRWAPKTAEDQGRSSFRASSGACLVM
jgi:hypothetical protein